MHKVNVSNAYVKVSECRVWKCGVLTDTVYIDRHPAGNAKLASVCDCLLVLMLFVCSRLSKVCGMFTSAKEVMFLPDFVCLSVCVLAR